MRVDYADAALASWTGAGQNSQIDLYPRQIYGNIPLAYYNAHNYSSPWYPNHTSQQHYETSDMYALAGLSDDPAGNPGDYFCMNMTHLISTNNCNQFQQNANVEMISVNAITYYPNVTQNLLDEVVVGLAFPTWADPTTNDCISQLAFRHKHLEDSVNGYWYHAGKVFSHFPVEKGIEYVVFGTDGRKFDSGVWPMGCTYIDISYLPAGMYVIRIDQSDKSQVIKATHY
jgi:hypothetical protein